MKMNRVDLVKAMGMMMVVVSVIGWAFVKMPVGLSYDEVVDALASYEEEQHLDVTVQNSYNIPVSADEPRSSQPESGNFLAVEVDIHNISGRGQKIQSEYFYLTIGGLQVALDKDATVKANYGRTDVIRGYIYPDQSLRAVLVFDLAEILVSHENLQLVIHSDLRIHPDQRIDLN